MVVRGVDSKVRLLPEKSYVILYSDYIEIFGSVYLVRNTVNTSITHNIIENSCLSAEGVRV